MAEKKEKKDTVRIRLPRERRDQDDKIVWVNARRFLIKRGVEVEVPKCVAAVLAHEEAMLQKAYEYDEQVKNKA